MKEIYLLRHGKRNADGTLTEEAREAALHLGKSLPNFSRVISSTVPRAVQTAALLAGKDPETDERAGFYPPAEEKSHQISEFGATKGLNFYDAAEQYQDAKLAEGIHKQALALLGLIDETLSQLEEGESALIVSHDLTIGSALGLRGIPRVSTDYLSGYRINEKGGIRKL